MSKRIRRPKAKGGANLATPNSDTGSTNSLTPVFCLHNLSGDYCLSRCDAEKKAAFADTLHKLSKISWSEIQRSGRHASGSEKIKQDDIKTKLPNIVTPDVSMLAFRFCGTAPMVGFRDGRVFHILFLDRDFSLYDHN